MCVHTCEYLLSTRRSEDNLQKSVFPCSLSTAGTQEDNLQKSVFPVHCCDAGGQPAEVCVPWPLLGRRMDLVLDVESRAFTS